MSEPDKNPAWLEPPLTGIVADITVRLADEHVPVRAIARAIKQSTECIRDTLRDAIAIGKITTMPRDDWHPGPKGEQPAEVKTAKMDDDETTFNCIRRFKVTQLHAALLVLLLKRTEVTKDMMHQAIEHLRITRTSKTNDVEETDPKMVDVVICNLRKRLKPHDLKIETSWGRGYYMSPDTRDRAKKMLTEYVDDPKKT